MPRLLVKRIDHSHPTKDALTYKRGDVVEAVEDSVIWKKIEEDVDTQFAIISTVGNVNEFKHLEQPKTVTIETPDGDKIKVVLRRLWTIDFGDMDAGELADLDSPPYKTSMTPGRVTVLSKVKAEQPQSGQPSNAGGGQS